MSPYDWQRELEADRRRWLTSFAILVAWVLAVAAGILGLILTTTGHFVGLVLIVVATALAAAAVAYYLGFLAGSDWEDECREFGCHDEGVGE